MSTDPRIEAAAKAVAEKQNVPFVGKKQCGIAEVALAAADAVDPLRNPTEIALVRAAAKSGHKVSVVRAVVAALRGGAE